MEATLRRVERRLAALDRAENLAWWGQYTGRRHGNPGRTTLARARFLSPPALDRWYRTALRYADPDGPLARRLEMLHRALLDARTEQFPPIVRLRTRLSRALVEFRPRWHGTRVGRSRVREELLHNPDPGERERAFRSEDEVFRRIEGPLRALVRLRNERARAEGFRDFPSLRLSFEGFTPESLRRLVHAALDPIVPRLRTLRETHLASPGATGWFPWDLPYREEQRAALPESAFPGRSMIPAARAGLEGWGFPRSRLGFRVVQHDLPFGGLTFGIRPPSDVRVLVHPQGGWSAYRILLHEFGHAIHFSSIDQPHHLLRSADAGFAALAEGIGGLFEEIALDERWVGRRPGVSRRDARRFRAGRAVEPLVRATTTAHWIETELALYRDPDGDPERASIPSLRRRLGFDRYAAPSWVRALYVTHPVYAQSYFLSVLFRKQLLAALAEAAGPRVWPNPRIGPWLAEHWFAPGARYDWVPHVATVTGRPFGPAAFLESARAAGS